jgi:hypothetical protein
MSTSNKQNNSCQPVRFQSQNLLGKQTESNKIKGRNEPKSGILNSPKKTQGLSSSPFIAFTTSNSNFEGFSSPFEFQQQSLFSNSRRKRFGTACRLVPSHICGTGFQSTQPSQTGLEV